MRTLPYDGVVPRAAGPAVKIVAGMLLALGVAVVPLETAAQARFNSDFDHFTTGFRLDGAHLRVECESCHVGGVFKGTPTQCSGCHAVGGRVQASAKPVNHPLTTNFCDDCHRTTAWLPLARMNHDSILGNCASCHNNVFTRRQAARSSADQRPVRHVPPHDRLAPRAVRPHGGG